MTELRVPYDGWAERAVIGCAVATRRGAEMAASRLTSADFYNPAHARLFAAALALGHLQDEDERITAAAVIARTDRDRVGELVRDRPVDKDTKGGFAKKVLDATLRRQVMAVTSEVYNKLGAGALLDDVLPVLRELVPTLNRRLSA